MRHIRAALLSTVAMIILMIMLANALRPWLPWIFALIILGCIVRLLWRS
jgi:hypothetical protein